MVREALEEQLKALPARPGVYLLKDDAGVVLYVGKAASLRSRVRSYFGSPERLLYKVQRMVEWVAGFEYIVTDTEADALLLECTLIKKHHPRYNIRLRDDKNYPYLKVGLDEEWPHLYITRRFEADGARFFGPYASADSIRRTLDLLKKLFPLCGHPGPPRSGRARPCLDYHLHRCRGACIGLVSREEYRRIVDQVILFLEGRQEQVVKELRRQMEKAAEALDFERAAFLRDQTQAVEKVLQGQKMVSPAEGDEDIIAFARERDQACVQVFQVREGKVTGRENFFLEGTQDEEEGRVMASFLKQYYGSSPSVPPRLLLQVAPEEAEVIGQWLKEKRGASVRLLVPQRGKRKELVDLVAENAAQVLEQFKVQWMADTLKTASALEELQRRLGLPRLPERMECYDISNIRGTSAVGSLVVLEKGKPKPSHYRRFRIKTVAGADDYAMLAEVLGRRFRRTGTPEAEGEAWRIVPDLVLIDGGRGQLNAALKAMKEQGVEGVPVAAIAKEREEFYLPDRAEPLLLPRDSAALFLLQRLRDEAHRFALSYHVKVRQRRGLTSAMDQIPGIGPKRKKMLLRRFGSVRGIREASLDDIAAVPGMTRSLAAKVKEYLGGS